MNNPRETTLILKGMLAEQTDAVRSQFNSCKSTETAITANDPNPSLGQLFYTAIHGAEVAEKLLASLRGGKS